MVKLVAWNAVVKKSLPLQGIEFAEEWLVETNEDKDSGKYRTVAYHIEKYGLQQARTFLKIDVEGTEYEVLRNESFYKYIGNVMQMIFEFHYLKERLAELTEYMKRIEQTHCDLHSR